MAIFWFLVLISNRDIYRRRDGGHFKEERFRLLTKTKELAYTSLVRPLMEFAAPIWDPNRVKDINKLEMVQRRAARFSKSGNPIIVVQPQYLNPFRIPYNSVRTAVRHSDNNTTLIKEKRLKSLKRRAST